MFRGKLGGHAAAHGVSSYVPVLVLRELGNDFFCRIGIKNRHVERHMHQKTGHSRLSDLIQQGQIGFCLHLGAGIKDHGSVGGIAWGQDGQIVLHFDSTAAGVLNRLNGAVLLTGDLQPLYLILTEDSVEAGAQLQGDVPAAATFCRNSGIQPS